MILIRPNDATLIHQALLSHRKRCVSAIRNNERKLTKTDAEILGMPYPGFDGTYAEFLHEMIRSKTHVIESVDRLLRRLDRMEHRGVSHAD